MPRAWLLGHVSCQLCECVVRGAHQNTRWDRLPALGPFLTWRHVMYFTYFHTSFDRIMLRSRSANDHQIFLIININLLVLHLNSISGEGGRGTAAGRMDGGRAHVSAEPSILPATFGT